MACRTEKDGDASHVLGAPGDGWNSRGTGIDAAMFRGEERGVAWMMRDATDMLRLMPDSDPFRRVVYRALSDTIAGREGGHNVENGDYAGTPAYNYGKQYLQAGTYNPLHWWTLVGSDALNQNFDHTVTAYDVSAWQNNWIIAALGEVDFGRGVPAKKLFAWTAENLLGQTLRPRLQSLSTISVHCTQRSGGQSARTENRMAAPFDSWGAIL